MTDGVERKLTTILAADVAAYSRHMQADEAAAMIALRHSRGVLGRLIERHRGRIANTAGDGLIAEFPSVVEAVRCAIEAQQELRDLATTPQLPMRYRIGLHLGDVMIDDGDLFGDGVNLAARLQELAEPGGILISRPVYDQVHAKLHLDYEPLGAQRPKNFGEAIDVFRLRFDGAPAPAADVAQPAPEPATDRESLVHSARWIGAIALLLVLLDVLTGPGTWAQFPILMLLTVFAAKRLPPLAPPWLGAPFARLGVIVAGLIGLNILTWTGHAWSLKVAIVLALAVILFRGRLIWR